MLLGYYTQCNIYDEYCVVLLFSRLEYEFHSVRRNIFKLPTFLHYNHEYDRATRPRDQHRQSTTACSVTAIYSQDFVYTFRVYSEHINQAEFFT